MTPGELAKDIVRLIACRNLQNAIRILEDSETISPTWPSTSSRSSHVIRRAQSSQEPVI